MAHSIFCARRAASFGSLQRPHRISFPCRGGRRRQSICSHPGLRRRTPQPPRRPRCSSTLVRGKDTHSQTNAISDASALMPVDAGELRYRGPEVAPADAQPVEEQLSHVDAAPYPSSPCRRCHRTCKSRDLTDRFHFWKTILAIYPTCE